MTPQFSFIFQERNFYVACIYTMVHSIAYDLIFFKKIYTVNRFTWNVVICLWDTEMTQRICLRYPLFLLSHFCQCLSTFHEETFAPYHGAHQDNVVLRSNFPMTTLKKALCDIQQEETWTLRCACQMSWQWSCFWHYLYQAMIPFGTIALLELLKAASWGKQGFPLPTNIWWCSKGSEHSQPMERHKIKHGEFLLHLGCFFSQCEELAKIN